MRLNIAYIVIGIVVGWGVVQPSEARTTNPKTLINHMNYLLGTSTGSSSATAYGIVLEGSSRAISQVSCRALDNKKVIARLQTCAVACNNEKTCLITCPDNKLGLEFLTFFSKTQVSAKSMTLECFSPGYAITSTQVFRSLPFQSAPKTTGFLGQLKLADTSLVTTIDSNPQTVKYATKLPFIPVKPVLTPFGTMTRFQKDSESKHVSMRFSLEDVSKPEVPVARLLIAIPMGAQIEAVTIRGEGSTQENNVVLYPIQSDWVDRKGFKAPEFAFNKDLYMNARTKITDYKIEPVKSESSNFVWLTYPLIDYDPATRTLTRYANIESGVKFKQNSKCFRDRTHQGDIVDQMRRFRRSPLDRMVANYDALEAYDCIDGKPKIKWGSLDPMTPPLVPPPFGPIIDPPWIRPIDPIRPIIEPIVIGPRPRLSTLHATKRDPDSQDHDLETLSSPIYDPMLVVIYHDLYEVAANELKQHKDSRGLTTKIVAVSTILGLDIEPAMGVTAAHRIKEYLKSAYERQSVKPQYLLLIGDSDQIPTFYSNDPGNADDRAPNAGDTWYGQLGQNQDEVPLVSVGRLPVRSPEEAAAIVQKIMNYENSPPSAPSYSQTVLATTTFMDQNKDGTSDRQVYSEVVERHYSPLIDQAGRSLKRVYKSSHDSQPERWSDATLLPDLLRLNLDWNQEGENLLNTFKDGFAVGLQRGHAQWDRWGQPDLHVNDIDGNLGFDDQRYPLMISLSCLSAMFDNETVYQQDRSNRMFRVHQGRPDEDEINIGEAFVRGATSAIGYIGATRSSRTTFNDIMGEGFVRALFADDPATSDLTLGSILKFAQTYLDSQHTGSGNAGLKEQLLIYNLLGDPSVELHLSPALYPHVLASRDVTPTTVNVVANLGLSTEEFCDSCALPQELLANAIVERQPILVLRGEGGSVLGRTVFNHQGVATVQLPVDQARNLQLTISGRDLKTKHVNL